MDEPPKLLLSTVPKWEDYENCDLITGFQVIDEKWRIVVLEGKCDNNGMLELQKLLPKSVTKKKSENTPKNQTKKMRFVFDLLIYYGLNLESKTIRGSFLSMIAYDLKIVCIINFSWHF